MIVHFFFAGKEKWKFYFKNDFVGDWLMIGGWKEGYSFLEGYCWLDVLAVSTWQSSAYNKKKMPHTSKSWKTLELWPWRVRWTRPAQSYEESLENYPVLPRGLVYPYPVRSTDPSLRDGIRRDLLLFEPESLELKEREILENVELSRTFFFIYFFFVSRDLQDQDKDRKSSLK